MDLRVLVYSPFLEEEDSQAGWDKSTIKYIQNNRSKIIKTIRGLARNQYKKNLQTADVEDIYSDVLFYLYKSGDYDIQTAIEKSSNGHIISLEGYINSCIKYCTLRYITKLYEDEKSKHVDRTDDDGKELSIFDTIFDETSIIEYDNVLYDLDKLCTFNECNRYKYGIDIYMLLYVRLLTIVRGIDDVYKDILNILGVSKKDLSAIEKKMCKDEHIMDLVKAIIYTGNEKSIQILEKYVYSSKHIKQVINSI